MTTETKVGAFVVAALVLLAWLGVLALVALPFVLFFLTAVCLGLINFGWEARRQDSQSAAGQPKPEA